MNILDVQFADNPKPIPKPQPKKGELKEKAKKARENPFYFAPNSYKEYVCLLFSFAIT